MKKNYFSLCLIVLSVGVKSQVLTYVGDGANVTIKENTLFYNGGGLQVAEATGANVSKIDNSGNVIIKASGVNDKLTVGSINSEFNLKSTSATAYGQLYIEGIEEANISGKLKKEYIAEFDTGGATGRQQIGLPFLNFGTEDLKLALENRFNFTNTSNSGSSGRFAVNSAFWWNNARARFDQIAVSGTAYTAAGVPNRNFINAMTYYILPKKNSGGTIVWNPKAITPKTFTGVPISDLTPKEVVFNLSGGYSGSFGANGSGKNTFTETYASYLNDPFEVKLSNWGNNTVSNDSYARNLYQLANPFLTNIDLKHIGTNANGNLDGNYISNLKGLAYYLDNAVSWNVNGSTIDPSKVVIVTVSSGVLQAGDVDRNDPENVSFASNTIIRPMGAFMVKLTDNVAQTLDFKKLRTFSAQSRANDGAPIGVASRTANENNIPADKIVKQVAVIMEDYDGVEIGRTYYAVSMSAVSGYSPAETNLQSYRQGMAIFTKEESASEGGEDIALTNQLYINEANEIDFKTKEIPLFIKADIPYKLKFETYELGERVSSLSNGNSFYIKNNDGNVLKINDDTILSMSGSQTLGLYYEKPATGTLSTNNSVKGQTVIGKKNSQWNVRFAKDWTSATVEVYSVTGQLLSSRKNVSTSDDYAIPYLFQTNSMYLIKAVSNNGDVVIKKITN